MKAKEQKKVEKYQDLKAEIANMWDMKRATVITLVVGTLRVVSTKLVRWIEKIGIEVRVKHLQKSALLGTVRIENGTYAIKEIKLALEAFTCCNLLSSSLPDG